MLSTAFRSDLWRREARVTPEMTDEVGREREGETRPHKGYRTVGIDLGGTQAWLNTFLHTDASPHYSRHGIGLLCI
jgi:hypothetical protein